jgi:predicted nucleotidyltransferase
MQLIMEPSPVIRAALEEFRDKLVAEFGPRLVRLMLFGSVARGEARWDSDVDVLVVLRGAVEPQTWSRIVDWGAAAMERHLVLISPTILSEAEYLEMLGQERRLVLDALREGIPL